MTQTNFVILRRDYLEVTGDYCAAKLIEYFKHWTHWKLENHRTEWVYQPIRRIWDDLLREHSQHVIRRAIAILEDIGLLSKRRNPGNGQDKTWQYKLNQELLKSLLEHGKSETEHSEFKNEHSEFNVEQHHRINTNTSNQSFYPNAEFKKEMELVDQEIPEVNQEPEVVFTQEPEITKPEITQEPEDFNQGKCSAPGVAAQKKCEVWEIAPGNPYPVFLNWWAKTKYEPQGGHWAKDALGNAYSEFYNNRSRTSIAIFPQFLEYMRVVTDNCNQQTAAQIKAILPSCFTSMPSATQENVQTLMHRIEGLIASGAEVSTNLNASPSCNQSISFASANDSSIKPLPKLDQPQITSSSSGFTPDPIRDYWDEVYARKERTQER